MRHIPVLLKAVVEGLNLKNDSRVIDCTLGDAGHSEAMLEKIGTKGKLLGIDADPESIIRAKKTLDRFEKQTIFVRDNFVNLKKIVEENKFAPVDAILMDLGWSTPQFKERGRGFSFEGDEPLDMRYSPTAQLTATQVVNEYPQQDLEKIFRFYGEDNFIKKLPPKLLPKEKKKRLNAPVNWQK